MKTYILKPTMTRPTLNLTPTPDKSAVARCVPPPQPLPRPVIDPAQPLLKLGLDVHLDFIMAVAQLLAIDLWRWRTGRATLQDLGWVAA